MCAYFHHHLSGRPTDRSTGIKTWISSNKELFSSAFCPAFWYWTKYPWSPCILYNWWLLLGCICGGWMACWGTSLVYLVFVVSYCLVLPGLRLYYKSQTEIAFSFLQVITSETKKKKNPSSYLSSCHFFPQKNIYLSCWLVSVSSSILHFPQP